MSQLMKNKIGQQVKPYAKGGIISKKAVGKKDIPDTDDTSSSKSPAPKKGLKKGGKC